MSIKIFFLNSIILKQDAFAYEAKFFRIIFFGRYKKFFKEIAVWPLLDNSVLKELDYTQISYKLKIIDDNFLIKEVVRSNWLIDYNGMSTLLGLF